MAEERYDPLEHPAVQLAIRVHERRESPDVKAVLELLKQRYEDAKAALVATSPWSGEPPGSLIHWQGQATALEKLIEMIEQGPDELRLSVKDEPQE